MNDRVIELTQLSKSYDNKGHVFQGLSLQVPRGSFLYIVGGTGAGKTTLLKMLATHENPTRGIVSLFGYDVNEVAPSLLRNMRQQIGYIPQTPDLVDEFTVYENVELSLLTGAQKINSSDRNRKVEESLKELGLFRLRNKKAFGLSGGERQRVAIARSLVRDPSLILADEPTGAQDRDSAWSIMNGFVQMNRLGVTILVATHDMEIVRRVRKPCAHIRDGQIVFEENRWAY